MPSGRDIHSTKPYVALALDGEALARMRAPPEPDDDRDEGASSSSDDGNEKQPANLPGAFPDGANTASGDDYY